MNDYLARAILKLKPGSEFRFENNDYSTIEWFKIDGDAPTQAEIDITIEEIKIEDAVQAEQQAQAKAQAETKLEALGLTPEDLKALGL